MDNLTSAGLSLIQRLGSPDCPFEDREWTYLMAVAAHLDDGGRTNLSAPQVAEYTGMAVKTARRVQRSIRDKIRDGKSEWLGFRSSAGRVPSWHYDADSVASPDDQPYPNRAGSGGNPAQIGHTPCPNRAGYPAQIGQGSRARDPYDKKRSEEVKTRAREDVPEWWDTPDLQQFVWRALRHFWGESVSVDLAENVVTKIAMSDLKDDEIRTYVFEHLESIDGHAKDYTARQAARYVGSKKGIAKWRQISDPNEGKSAGKTRGVVNNGYADRYADDLKGRTA